MVRTRLSAADILHRGVVLSLIGVCVWGIGTGILVHRDTLRMGRGTYIPHRFRFSPVDSDHNLLCFAYFFFSTVVPSEVKFFLFIDTMRFG
jgi:hypothetical protein